VSEDDLQLRLASLRDPKGQACVQGRISSNGKMDLHINSAEIDLAAWGEQLNRPELSGVAFVCANVSGTPEDLVGDAELVAFGAGSQQFSTDALFVRASIEQSAIALGELLVSRGSTMLAGSGRLAGLSRVAQQMPVAAQLRLVGLQLEEISDEVGLGRPISGVAEASATLSGTINDPRLSIELAVPSGYYGPYPVTEATVGFVVDRQRAEITAGNFHVSQAVITMQGYLEDWLQLLAGEPVMPEFAARLSVNNIDLQSIVSPQETEVAIAGRVDLPEIEIHSSPQGPVGRVHLVVPHLVIGGQQVSAINTMIRVGQGKVSLADTSLQVGAATIQAAGSYQWERSEGLVNLQLSGGRISELLRLAAPVSKLLVDPPAGDRLAQRLRGLALRSRGDIDLAVKLEGSPEQMSVHVQTTVSGPSFDRKSLPDISGGCTVEVTDGQLTAVHNILADVTQGEGLLIIEGEIDPDGELSLLADGTNFNIALWRDWLPEKISLGGTLGVITVAASGPTRQPSFRGSVFVDSPTFEGIKFDQANIPVLSLDETGLDIDMLLLKRGDQQIVLRGKLPVQWNPLGLAVDQPIQLSAKLENTDLGIFPALLDEFVRARAEQEPEQTLWSQLRARGRVDSEISISGRVDDSTIEGYAHISDGKIALPGWDQGLEGLDVNAAVQRRGQYNVISIDSAAARLDGTDFKLDGSVALTQFTSF